MASLKTLGNTRVEVLLEFGNPPSGPKKSKDITPIEMTNKLDIRPIKLKATRVGSINGSG